MNVGCLLDRLTSRIALDRQEGDIAYFHALTLQLEYITKLVTAGVVACVGDDADRHRYSLEHTLVRADSVGHWTDALDHALTGPPAQYFLPKTSDITRDLTERVADGDWRYKAVGHLYDVATRLGINAKVGQKVSLRQFFHIGAAIRNRTRGHGATTSEQCGSVCPLLADAIEIVLGQLKLFRLDWAHLHRNLSGKYRVSPLLGDCSKFEYLKKTRDVQLPNGVFIDVGGPIYIPLVFSDPDLRDVLVPNGNFKSSTFEVLSYVTNEVGRIKGTLPFSRDKGDATLFSRAKKSHDK
jgi:hypothetical protein